VVTTAVVDYPAAKRRYWAVRGGGAFADGDPIQASTVAWLAEATVCDDYRRNIERATPGHPFVQLARHCSTVHPYEGRHSMLEVASGQADVALDSGGVPWDYAPFVILVEEAGGVAGDIQGKPVLTVAHSSSLTVAFTVRSSRHWIHSRAIPPESPGSAGVSHQPGERG
jgi:fructose-1,6-bisphosphatase/inositol monophosphatase family enzyme